MSESRERRRHDRLDAALDLLGSTGERHVVPVSGTSMEPTLSPGDALLVEFGTRRPRTGDLVLFRQQDGLVVHRFLARVRPRGAAGSVLRLRGDGRPTFDPPVDDGDLRAVVRAIRRRGTWWGLGPGIRERAWALAVASHDHAWGLAFALARRIRGGDAAPGRSPRFARWLWIADRTLLRAADRFLFRWFHRRVPSPPVAIADPPGSPIAPLL